MLVCCGPNTGFGVGIQPKLRRVLIKLPWIKFDDRRLDMDSVCDCQYISILKFVDFFLLFMFCGYVRKLLKTIVYIPCCNRKKCGTVRLL